MLVYIVKDTNESVLSLVRDVTTVSGFQQFLITAYSNQTYPSIVASRQFGLRVLLPAQITKMSYADIAASGPKQAPEDPPEVVTNESASTASLVDVDMPSVHTVPSDFQEQDVQTETQAQRLEREAEQKKVKAKSEAKKTDNWLTEQFAKLSDGSAGALAIANLAGVVGLSAYMGYKAWGLYERGRLSYQNVGVGVGILAAVGAAEGVFGRYLYKGKKDASS
ncbi:uncharacterized protein J7T54_002939 [Emericellopsis cladophorae]|uniref:Mitochondrial outer membrane protein OM14 C-terminal domain-containing protein n=1 Tax=Emericellopsis cladophorae TaxID=2686198 RepID=A0A9P9XTH1_9HYPO|nr:uncharacterized protein J7T54_002939 [Emericellopsis cladophorae]KAI6777628.1 hypothetical protein J7T54_002939 [Emericellopsis cladophorae]